MTHSEKLLNAALRRMEARYVLSQGYGRRRARRAGRAFQRGYLQAVEEIGSLGARSA